MRTSREWSGAAFLLIAALGAGTARAACDPGVVSSDREAIDDACPCGDFSSRSAYRTCANQVVRAQVTAALLPSACRREVLRHAKLSTCGRQGTAVCCRVRADGRTRHRIVRDAADCTPTSAFTACVSELQSVPIGCAVGGCVPLPVCGNDVVEPTEDCDPPDNVYCDTTCESRLCAPPVTTCGNGTVDAGEACEPPGVGNCTPDCQTASCAAPVAGELGIACSVASGSVSAAATASSYLLGWNDASPLATNAVVRRFDLNGAPLDSGRTVLSTDVPCGSFHERSALASDGQDFYAVWSSIGPTEFPSFVYLEMLGRRVGGGSGIGPLDHLSLSIPVGTCSAFHDGPTMAAAVSPARFAVGWHVYGSCFGQLVFSDPVPRVVDFNAVPVPQSFDIGLTEFGSSPPLGASSQSAASVAQLGTDTVWVWHALFASGPEPPYEHFVTAVFTDLDGADPHVIVSHRNERIGGRPAVAAGASSLLVAWGQGASAVATTVTEIRAVRATRADGRLDPDGGLLLATSSTEITGGPVVAFDGTRWLVVWVERSSGTTHDLRAVAVAADGSVVDSSRLVASDVVAAEPAVASAGDGRVLVVFARPHGTTRDVVATFVTP